MSTWGWLIRFFAVLFLILPVALILGLAAVAQRMYTMLWRG